VKSKKILIIIIMVALVSSVVAGAVSLFNTSGNNDVYLCKYRMKDRSLLDCVFYAKKL
jgi:flagellar basal body-associated protein FliL